MVQWLAWPLWEDNMQIRGVSPSFKREIVENLILIPNQNSLNPLATQKSFLNQTSYLTQSNPKMCGLSSHAWDTRAGNYLDAVFSVTKPSCFYESRTLGVCGKHTAVQSMQQSLSQADFQTVFLGFLWCGGMHGTKCTCVFRTKAEMTSPDTGWVLLEAPWVQYAFDSE